jgi:hypothetical protein
VIQNDIPIRLISGEGLSQLLKHPIRSWVSSDVTVQNLATAMFDHKQAAGK